MKRMFLILLTFLAVGCGTRNVKPGELPRPGQGVAFLRVAATGSSETMIHIFKKGDRMGPHKARIDASNGVGTYAVILPEGEYDIGQISAGGRTDIWPGDSSCQSFKVYSNKTTYAGTLLLFIRIPQYSAECDYSVQSKQDATSMFARRYIELFSRYDMAN